MKSKLARAFIEKSIIQRGSILEAFYSTKGISGQCDAQVLGSFKLIGAQAVGEWVFFETIGPDDKQYRVRCDNVVSLDGMPLERITESHQLTLDGEPATAHRRGRRKKVDDEDDDGC